MRRLDIMKETKKDGIAYVWMEVYGRVCKGDNVSVIEANPRMMSSLRHCHGKSCYKIGKTRQDTHQDSN